eukprot:TRINITY_DN102490_c0_g1_i1.p1 TRINITY_DN102490_c0_g1~~TRINITY_DN102490_c0_g1_i1.p1  ORF type:complete len:409 (+),score=87.05 TRINITY_DN102490_c0_g1_i1:184-1410(+)
MAFQAAPVFDWQKLHKVLPLGRGREERDARIQLFKDLITRGKAPKETLVTSKAEQKKERYRIRGTLSHAESTLEIAAMLLQHGVVAATDAGALQAALHRAFYAARAWVEPVTSFDETFIDMNQFHAMLTHLTYDVDLRCCLAAAGLGRNGAQLAVTQQDFKRILDLLGASGAPSRLQCDWDRIGEFESWRENAAAAFVELGETGSCMVGVGGDLQYENLLERCMQHVVAETVASGEFYAENRKAAFQLVQALQGVDSLPYCVPGPFDSSQETSRGAMTSSRSSTTTPSGPGGNGFFAGETVGGPLAWRSMYSLSNEYLQHTPRRQPQYVPLGMLELTPPPTNRGREESSLHIVGVEQDRRSARLAAAGGVAFRKEIVTSIGQGLASPRDPLKLTPGRILYKTRGKGAV